MIFVHFESRTRVCKGKRKAPSRFVFTKWCTQCAYLWIMWPMSFWMKIFGKSNSSIFIYFLGSQSELSSESCHYPTQTRELSITQYKNQPNSCSRKKGD